MSTISAYTGDGSTTQFDITFTYRDADTVKASVDGEELDAFSFVNPSRIEFDVAPALGTEIKIFRRTTVSPAVVDFQDGAIIRGDDLNDAIAQPRDRTEELDSELTTLSGQAVKVPLGEDAITIPSQADRAGKFMGFGVGGVPVALSDTGTDAGLRTDLATDARDLVAVGDASLGEALVANILSYGADPTGAVLADAAFAAAIADGYKAIRCPAGIYKVDDLAHLHNAGLTIFGDGRFVTELRVATGATGAVFYNPTAAGSTSYGISISDLFINLNGQNVTAIDLSSVNNSTVRRVRFVGGSSIGTATGVAVRCAAPRAEGAYTNKIVDCDATYMARAFVAEDGANENTFDNCEAIACPIGFDVEAGVDRVRIIGGRAEGGTRGIRTGGQVLTVLGTGFEANTVADVSFVAGAQRNTFFGCYTASSAAVFENLTNVTGLLSRGGTFPQYDFEPNNSNPRVDASRKTFAASGSIGAIVANLSLATPGSLTGYGLYAFDPIFLKNNTGTIEAVNATTDNTVLMFSVDGSNRLNIAGFDRKAGAYTRIYIGPNFSFNGTGLEYAGTKVLGARGASLPADATDLATVITLANAIKARLKATGGHGLVAD